MEHETRKGQDHSKRQWGQQRPLVVNHNCIIHRYPRYCECMRVIHYDTLQCLTALAVIHVDGHAVPNPSGHIHRSGSTQSSRLHGPHHGIVWPPRHLFQSPADSLNNAQCARRFNDKRTTLSNQRTIRHCMSSFSGCHFEEFPNTH